MTEVEAERMVEEWQCDLRDSEAASATIEKYVREVRHLLDYLALKELPLDRAAVLSYKEHLVSNRAPAGANTAIASMNRFFAFLGRPELRLRHLKIQRMSRCAAECLTKRDYKRLVRTGNEHGMRREALIVQTLCATGMRASELSAVTVEALRSGYALVANKGRVRRVWFPQRLCKLLKIYARQQGIKHGPIFITRTGHAIERTRIWRMLKKLAARAGIAAHKVFPHALRHLFALTFQHKHHDIESLAGILGHAHVETTRIYLAIDEHLRCEQVSCLGFV